MEFDLHVLYVVSSLDLVQAMTRELSRWKTWLRWREKCDTIWHLNIWSAYCVAHTALLRLRPMFWMTIGASFWLSATLPQTIMFFPPHEFLLIMQQLASHSPLHQSPALPPKTKMQNRILWKKISVLCCWYRYQFCRRARRWRSARMRPKSDINKTDWVISAGSVMSPYGLPSWICCPPESVPQQHSMYVAILTCCCNPRSAIVWTIICDVYGIASFSHQLFKSLAMTHWCPLTWWRPMACSLWFRFSLGILAAPGNRSASWWVWLPFDTQWLMLFAKMRLRASPCPRKGSEPKHYIQSLCFQKWGVLWASDIFLGLNYPEKW